MSHLFYYNNNIFVKRLYDNIDENILKEKNMISVKEMRNRLPKDFMDFLYGKYNELEVDNILLRND